MRNLEKYHGVIPAFYACYDKEGNISVEGVSEVNTWKEYQSKDYKGTMVEVFFHAKNLMPARHANLNWKKR